MTFKLPLLLYVIHFLLHVVSGSDGLVKLWTIKTNECVATLDEHVEKVWSLTTSSDGERLVSGGADSVVCQWKAR